MASALPKIGPSVRGCRSCGTTHVRDVACPPAGRWLVSGQRVDTGRAATVTPILHAPSRKDR